MVNFIKKNVDLLLSVQYDDYQSCNIDGFFFQVISPQDSWLSENIERWSNQQWFFTWDHMKTTQPIFYYYMRSTYITKTIFFMQETLYKPNKFYTHLRLHTAKTTYNQNYSILLTVNTLTYYIL